MSNKLLGMVNERLRAQGQKGLDAAPTPTATAQPAQTIKTMPGSFDIFTQNLDQPEAAAPNDAELARRARLAQTASVAACSWTEQERIAAAKARRDAILQQR